MRFINYSLKQPSNEELINNNSNKSNHLCINTDQYEADENELINESIEFPIVNSFDLRKEVANSCLREVNLKLRYAQIKHIDDLLDENQPIKQEKSADETVDERESNSSQFLISALKRSQGEQRHEVQEEVEKNAQHIVSSDYSQVKCRTATIINPFLFYPSIFILLFPFFRFRFGLFDLHKNKL